MIGIDEAYFVIAVVRHIHVAKGVGADTVRISKKRGRADPIDGAACDTRRAAARKGNDGLIGIDEADFVIIAVRHIQVANGVGADTIWPVKKCGRADPID